jgi:hypothetical protein
MITARNYAAQCVSSMRKMRIKGSDKDTESLNFLLDEIESSVHFAIPDEGKFFNDGLKGIVEEEIRLPFDAITLEFYSDAEIKKRLILAREVEGSSFAGVDTFPVDWLKGTVIAMNVFWCDDEDGHWNTDLFSCLMTTNKPVKPDGTRLLDFLYLPYFHDSISKIEKKILIEELDERINITRPYVRSLFEFIEAMSCSNVEKEIHNKADLKRQANRASKNKKPIFETYRLTVQVPGSGYKSSADASDSGRASPREHLRRGHIRRIVYGKKIWINSCVDGNRSEGINHKSYGVCPA